MILIGLKSMAKVYEWIDKFGNECLIEVDNNEQWKKHKGIFIDEVLKNKLILKTKGGTEVEILTNNLKVYEV